MSEPLTPTFSSAELQKAVTAARPLLEGIDDARNRVSNDIKALEAYLHRLGLEASFKYSLGRVFVPENEVTLAASGGSSGEFKEESLVWGEYRTGTWRLLYESRHWDGYVDVDGTDGPFFCDESTLKQDVKPLIETKIDIRERMYQHLPSFVSALAKLPTPSDGVPLWKDLPWPLR
jgi:hypothetical protein